MQNVAVGYQIAAEPSCVYVISDLQHASMYVHSMSLQETLDIVTVHR